VSIIFRPLALSDLSTYPALRLEALKLYPEAFSADYATQAQYPPSYWEGRVRGAIDNPQQIIYVAAAGQELVGMTGIVRGDSPKNQHSALIISVYVRSSHRRQHIGEKLLQACLDWARDQGVRIVKLGVSVSNIPALRCYERCGFTQYGCEPQALYVGGKYLDECLMALAL